MPCNAPFNALSNLINNCNHIQRDNNKTEMFPGPERSKDISKIVHVTSGVQPYEAMRIRCVHKENKNNFIQQFFPSSSRLLWSAAIVERVS